MARRVYRRNVHEAIAACEEFQYNRSAHGEWVKDRFTVGGLNDKEQDRLLKHVNAGLREEEQTFIVFSYQVPIGAYNRTKGWWTTDRYFSRTTSVHQGFIRKAIS